VDPTPEHDVDADGGDGPQESLLTDIASSIPGIDEAMVRATPKAAAGFHHAKTWTC
jgi:hypothetical protein